MQKQPLSTVLVLSIALVALSPAALLAAKEKAPEPVGHVRSTPSVIEWDPAVDYDRLLLTVVAPDGEVFSKEFGGASKPMYRLQDHPKRGSLDGTYSYEIRVVPKINEAVRRRLEEARAAGDEGAIRRIQREAGIEQIVVQSGGFSVLNGSFVPLDREEGTAADSLRRGVTTNALPQQSNDQVIPDDLIVQASLCVGFDCVVNEDFGFDTVRLKENNLRIRFLDTSAGSFPSNDWQIVANDSASGGLNKLAIEDATGARTPFTVEGGAVTNSIYVSASGNVGLSTSTPVLDLHIHTSDTPALRLQQDATGGFTAQTWDVAGNEANFFVRDVTGGSRLPFRIRPGATTSSLDIGGTGNVGINNSSPKRKLHLIGPSGSVPTFPESSVGPQDVAIFENNGNLNVSLVGAASTQTNIRFLRSGSTVLNGWIRYEHTADALTLGTSALERFRIGSDGYIGLGINPALYPIHHSNGAYLSVAGVWTNASSRDYKENITDLDGAEAKDAVMQMRPVKYDYKIAPSERHVGFIAEDVPALVATQDRKGMSPMDVVAVLTKVVQEQQKTIEELSARIGELEKGRN